MEVVQAAVHYVLKRAHSDEAVVTPAEGVLEISPELKRLVVWA